MNILQVVPRLDIGGVETGTVDLAHVLAERGHKPVIISSGGRLVAELEASSIKHYYLAVDKKSIITVLRMIPKVIDIIRKEDIDIVHARSRVPAWICFFASKKTNRTFMTTCHGYYSTHFFSRIMARGKFVIVASQVIARHMIDDFYVSPERLRLIERSVNIERFRFRPPKNKSKTEFIIANIARLTPIKGHEYFLKAVAKLIRSIPHIQVWIVGDSATGDSSYRQELEVLTRRLGISHCVKFMGLRADVPKILLRVNVLVLSTVTQEAFGRVVIEAQASGVPVVATNVGGVVEIVKDQVTGLLVPPKDPEAMARAIMMLLKDSQLSQTLAENAYKKVKEVYTLSRMVDKTLEVYDEAQKIERILVIKFSALGDILLITPSLRALRNKFNKAKIYCLTSLSGSKILKNCPYLDDLIIYDKVQDNSLAALLEIARKLRGISFDKVVDFQNNSRSHVLSFLSLAGQRYGYDNGKLSFLLNRKVKEKYIGLSPVRHQEKTLSLLDIKLKSERLEIWPTEADEDYIDELIKSHWLGKAYAIVGVHIGASSAWPTKLWPARSVSAFIDELAKENIRVILMGSDSEKARAEAILAQSKSSAINLCAKTSLLQLAALIKRCSAILTYDSLAMHMASAVGVPFVGLFGPTDPARHLPPTKKYITVRKDMSCSPCYRRDCKNNRCMMEITPKEVVSAVKSLI
ncbi:MAG: GT4 family glycosyltransferase PelF [Candidatus Omnitrophica bacterium]|nr:GT4 family glycosyltransferase PelF [Candidatus Omnitrophota bacterium]